MRGGLVTTILAAAVAAGIALAVPAAAVEPGERLADPKLEARARALSAELRCLVCQNQSIDDSNAPLARDLRGLVRERLLAGDSDRQILDFVVARYGEFVLLRPPLAPHTLILWLAPAAALGLGALALVLTLRRRVQTKTVPEPLSDEERQRLQSIIGPGPRPRE
jgi:cytochrome c-type biogenesis protein CcmH